MFVDIREYIGGERLYILCWHYKSVYLFYSDLPHTDNDQQSYQRLTQTSERMRFGRCWTFWAYYCEL